MQKIEKLKSDIKQLNLFFESFSKDLTNKNSVEIRFLQKQIQKHLEKITKYSKFLNDELDKLESQKIVVFKKK